MPKPNKKHIVQWNEVDIAVANLNTDTEHLIQVQREAIPLVFVPGIMGSRLRRTGTDGVGDGDDGLPNLRWDPGDARWMIKHFSGESPQHRKRMLIGSAFDPDFLEVDKSTPIGNGFRGLMKDYHEKFLKVLLKEIDVKWRPLGKIFVFPVFGVGYNWTDSSDTSGKKLAARIAEIIAEAKQITGRCEKVIVITHSMGGIVARSASELHGARSSILGVIHGVQPATGAAAAYWRMKAGFEGIGPTSRILGNSGPTVTAVLGNMPGGLELLPNKFYRSGHDERGWLRITEKGGVVLDLPKVDPYDEIYRVPADVQPRKGEKPSKNTYWGLVDPNLLDPGSAPAGEPSAPVDQSDPNSLSRAIRPNSWTQYLDLLDIAESFHDRLGRRTHPKTFCFYGVGHDTADTVELRIESSWVSMDPYPKRGFRGFFTNSEGKSMKAVLQDPAGAGDGTVPISSATFACAAGLRQAIEVEHQPAFEEAQAQRYTSRAIISLCKEYYAQHRSAPGDFPLSESDSVPV